MTSKIEKLCDVLGYKFKNIELLKLALSHRSIGSQSNERMEFLGDSVLNMIMADELFHRYSDLQEGELSRLRALLVNGNILADLARELDIGQYMFLGTGELKNRGFQRSSILADAMEAIIGAIYLESGIDIAKERVLHWYKDKFHNLPLTASKDPKTQLQELLQAKALPLPIYQVKRITGDAHAQVFHVECSVKGFNYVAAGVGVSKRRAEQNAAELFLQNMKQ